MQVDVRRIIRDPASGAISAELKASITEEDIALVFPCDVAHDAELHFDLTGPCDHTDSRNLEVWMKFAKLLEAALGVKTLPEQADDLARRLDTSERSLSDETNK